MTGPLIKAQGLGLKVEDRWLIKNLDLSLDRGSFLAVTGPSGSGKTTLLRTLAGEMEASLGSVKKQLDCHNRLAMIFQDLQLADGATALTNVLGGSLERHSFLSTFFGFPTHEQIEANVLLTQFGLAEKAHQWTSTLSRGERQRVAVIVPCLPARYFCWLTNLYQVSIQIWLIKFWPSSKITLPQTMVQLSVLCIMMIKLRNLLTQCFTSIQAIPVVGSLKKLKKREHEARTSWHSRFDLLSVTFSFCFGSLPAVEGSVEISDYWETSRFASQFSSRLVNSWTYT